MPITIKLSKAFCDAVGEQAANELVDWLNTVDKSAHSEIAVPWKELCRGWKLGWIRTRSGFERR